MPADFSLAMEFLGLVAAAALAAYGVWKLSAKLVAAGGAVFFLIWLLAAGLAEDEWTQLEFVSLRLRAIDAASGEIVPDAMVMADRPADTAQATPYRLPSTNAPRASSGAITVSLVVELRIKGSLLDQLLRPAAQTKVIDRRLMITAAGHRPWRGRLTELLPDGWPVARLSERAIKIQLERDDG